MRQTFQFGRVRAEDAVLIRYSKKEKGRPDLAILKRAEVLGYNYCWLYTKATGKPELCDGIVLNRKKISKRETPA